MQPCPGSLLFAQAYYHLLTPAAHKQSALEQFTQGWTCEAMHSSLGRGRVLCGRPQLRPRPASLAQKGLLMAGGSRWPRTWPAAPRGGLRVENLSAELAGTCGAELSLDKHSTVSFFLFWGFFI